LGERVRERGSIVSEIITFVLDSFELPLTSTDTSLANVNQKRKKTR